MTIFNDLKNNKLVVIRFNPDKYIDKNKIKSLFSLTLTTGELKITNQILFDLRMAKLVNEIKYNINCIPINKLHNIKLFYDE